MFWLCPNTFDFQRDAVGFYKRYHYVFLCAAVLYYPVIFGLRHVLRDSTAFDLGGAPAAVLDVDGKPKKDAEGRTVRRPSQATFNYIFWWETGLALFSILGAYHVVPLAFDVWQSEPFFVDAVCRRGLESTDVRYWWIFLFNVSKLFEFGDTLFVVLRKKKLILLQHYHHLATMCYCWWVLFFFFLKDLNFFPAVDIF